jgi:hypothetical protein
MHDEDRLPKEAALRSTSGRREDSGCDYDAVGQRRVYPHNNILMIFQPKGTEGWIDDASIIFTLTKEAKAAGYKFNLAAYSDIIETVNKKLYEAFCNFLTTSQNKWFSQIKEKYDSYTHFVNDFCGMKKPLHEEKGVIKFTYEIKWFYMEYSIHNWNAVELMEWMKTSPSYESYINSIKAREAAKGCSCATDGEECGEACKWHKEYQLIRALPKNETNYLDDDVNLHYLIERGHNTATQVGPQRIAGTKRSRDDDDDDDEVPLPNKKPKIVLRLKGLRQSA